MRWPKVMPLALACCIKPEEVNQLLGAIPGDVCALHQTPDGRRELAGILYNALLSKNIRYDLETFSTDSRFQIIREPSDLIRGSQRGTCLDMTLLFAGACLSYDLIPLIVLLTS
jgi:hypothetical protein